MMPSRVVTGAACSGCGRMVALRAGRCSSCQAKLAAVACAKCGLVRPPQRRFGSTVAWCGTCCRRHDRVVEIVELRGDVIGILGAMGVESEEVGKAFDAVVGSRDVALLRAAVRCDPNVFAGSPTAPPVVDRLIGALRSVGADGPVLPRCCSCGTSDRLTSWINGQRSCEQCAYRARARPCGTCGSLVVRPGATGKLVDCVPCRVAARTEARTARCERCGRDRPLVRRKAYPDSRLCADCVPLPIVSCAMCGRERPGNSGARSGRARCVNCAAARATCSVCSAPGRAIAGQWATGPVCAACRTRVLAQRSTCAGCGQHRRIDPRNTNGQLHCSICAGLEPFSVCSRCGTEDRIYRNRQCFACLLDTDLDELVARNPALGPFQAALRASGAPRTVLRWLGAPVVKSTINAIASNHVTVSHRTLDAVGSDRGVAHLRAVFVECGLLEPRDEQAARLEAFVARQIASIKRVEDRQLVEAFATWQVLRRHRQRTARREHTGMRVDDTDARNDVLYAIRFLDWLHEQNVTLKGCTQRNVDEWTSGPPGRRETRDFVRWAVKRRLATGIDIGKPRDQTPARAISTEDLTVLVRRFLIDDTIRLPERVAGLFVMCFAQRLTGIVNLRRCDVETRDGHEWVQFGDTPIQLPESIGVLARALCDNARGHATTGASNPSPWLFPGGRPGRPISAEGLGLRLRQYGVRANTARTAAMLDLAAELPPAVLGDMIGLFPSTAVRWVHAAGGDWTTYVAERTRDETGT